MKEQHDIRVSKNKIEKDNIPKWLEKIRRYYAGEMHSHSKKSDRSEIGGARDGVLHNYNSLMRYADKLGLDFVVFSEHASNPDAPELLEEDSLICSALVNHQNDIDKINNSKKYSPVAFSAVEASVFFDKNNQPMLDVPDSVLSKIDLVIASRHTISEPLEPKKIKESLFEIINNPEVDIIGHPYRGIEFYKNDWNYFKKYFRNDNTISEELKKMEEDEQWDEIKKIIGKTDISGGGRTAELRELFSKLQVDYWEMWDEVLDEMERHGKAFEINLNVFSPGKEFYRSLLEKAVQRNGLMFSISYDFHNLSQRKKFKDNNNEEALKDVKNPDRAKAIQRLLGLVELLEDLNIKPNRIVNSSLDNLQQFVSNRKKERNIQVLKEYGYEIYCDIERLGEILNNDIIGLEAKEVMVRDGEVFQFQLRCKSNDGREYFFKKNSDYDLEKVFELAKLLNSESSGVTNEPLFISESKDVLAYEEIKGEVGREKIINGTKKEREAIAEKFAGLIKSFHEFDINKFKSCINTENYSLRNIKKSSNVDFINTIGAKNENLGRELNSIYEELAEIETEILENSQKVLIHGDFHPGNVLLDNKSEAKLIDPKNITIGIKERDVASMMEQVYAQCGNGDGKNMEANDVLEWQEHFLKNYKDNIDSQKLIFYRAWISLRNSIYCFLKYYMGKNKNIDSVNGKLFLANATKYLAEYKSKLSE